MLRKSVPIGSQPLNAFAAFLASNAPPSVSSQILGVSALLIQCDALALVKLRLARGLEQAIPAGRHHSGWGSSSKVSCRGSSAPFVGGYDARVLTPCPGGAVYTPAQALLHVEICAR